MENLTSVPLSYKNASFENWISILNSIYGDKNHQRTPSEMWLRAVSDASKVGESVRRGEPYDAMRYFVHTLGWVLTTFQKLSETEYNGLPALQTIDNKPHKKLTSMILSKYPGICPYCGCVKCNCPSMRETLEKETKLQRRQRLLKTYSEFLNTYEHPTTISDMVSMFDNIYRQVHYGETIEKITFHFLEEVGEVAWCITSLEEGTNTNPDRIPLNVQLAEEISDVVAWGIGVVGKLISLAEQSDRLTTVIRIGENLSELQNSVLERQYVIPRWLCHIFFDINISDFVCHTCHKKPCRC